MQITIIGCGNMGRALAQRLAERNQLYFYDRHPEKAEALALEGFGTACSDIQESVQSSSIIILAVKPQNLSEVAAPVAQALKEEQILVSLLAGITTEMLRRYFPNETVVRMMPNLALICGKGVIGLCSDRDVKDEAVLTHLFGSLGKVHWLPETKIDALTALTASGPAFFLVMIEAMIDAGIAMGFTAQDSQGLVQQMVQGSLALMETTGLHPGALKWQIASPRGTTIAGLKKLEDLALRGSIMSAFLAAFEVANNMKNRAL